MIVGGGGEKIGVAVVEDGAIKSGTALPGPGRKARKCEAVGLRAPGGT